MIKASQLKNHTMSEIAKALSQILSKEDQSRVLRRLEMMKIKKEEEKAQDAYDSMEDKRKRHESWLIAMRHKYGPAWLLLASTEELRIAFKREDEYAEAKHKWLNL